MAKFCTNCGQELIEGAKTCGNCGASTEEKKEETVTVKATPASGNTANNASNQSNGMAIGGFVVSLVSLLCCGILSIVSLILSIIGLNNSKNLNDSGKGLAIAGIIISAIALVFWVIGIILWTAGFSTAWQEAINEIFILL